MKTTQTFLILDSRRTVTTFIGNPIGVPIRRTTQIFSDYKRFTGEVQITPLRDAPR